MFRVQVGSEATEFILLVDNGTSVPQIRPDAACFAVLDVLVVCASYEGVCCGGAAD